MYNSLKQITALSAGIALGLTACSAEPASQTSISIETIERAEQILQPWVSDDAPGVSVALSWNDEVVFARGAGLANLEHEQPITPESVFQAASVSKQFTAFATLLLVFEGAIGLNDDIRDYVPELKETEKAVTVRHLLNHTSGLKERNTLARMAGWMADDIRTEAQYMELVSRQRGVNFAAGDEVEYSNTGYALLAEIVARVSGQSFQSFMEDRVFKPLDMNQTRFPQSRNAFIPRRASSYYPSRNGFKNVIAASEATGPTGLYTTSLDLLKWAENFETQKVGDPAIFEMMAARSKAANGDDATFARGQELRPYNGLETWSHGGRDAGYRSFLLRIPGQDFELSILSNRTDFDTADMAFALTDVFLEAAPEYQPEPTEPWTPASPEALEAFAGDYELYPGTMFSLRVEKGGLTFGQFGMPRDGLEPLAQIGRREFLLNRYPELALRFLPPENGVSPGFGYRIGLHGTIMAKRLDLAPFEPALVNLDAFTGRYESAELGAQYEVFIQDGKLTAKHMRLPAFALSPYQKDVFAAQGGPLQKVEFIRDADEAVIGFYASAALAERIKFRRARSGRDDVDGNSPTE